MYNKVAECGVEGFVKKIHGWRNDSAVGSDALNAVHLPSQCEQQEVDYSQEVENSQYGSEGV